MGSANYNFIECSPSDGLAAVIASCPSLTLQGFEEETRKRMYQSYEEEDEFCDEAGHVHVEKKRRLSIEQVKSLERSFEVENKLEPDRKIQLAKELGLQPRQIAVWFQNRRARWKTKQLEKDYDALKSEYEDLKLSYIDLQKDRDRLQTELTRLKERLCTDELKQAPSCEIGCSRVKIEEPLNELPVIQSVELAPDYICKLQRPQIETMYKKEGSLSSESEASEVSQAESPTGNLNESLNTPSISHNYTYQQHQQQVQHQNAGLYVGSLDDYRTIPRAFAYRAEDQQDLFWSPW